MTKIQKNSRYGKFGSSGEPVAMTYQSTDDPQDPPLIHCGLVLGKMPWGVLCGICGAKWVVDDRKYADKFGPGGSGPPPERADDPYTGDTIAHAHARGVMARMEAMPKPPPTKVRCQWCPTVNHLVPAEVKAMCSAYGGEIRCSGCGRKQTIRHQPKDAKDGRTSK